jgi:hypothetical protein
MKVKGEGVKVKASNTVQLSFAPSVLTLRLCVKSDLAKAQSENLRREGLCAISSFAPLPLPLSAFLLT